MLSNYKLSVVLAVIASVLVIFYIIQDAFRDSLAYSSANIGVIEREFRFEEFSKKNGLLEDYIARHGIEVVTKQEAENILVEYMDELRFSYQATIVKSITDEDSVLSSTLEFSYSFTSTDSFYEFLRSVESNVQPIVAIDSLSLTEGSSNDRVARPYELKVVLTLRQPYMLTSMLAI